MGTTPTAELGRRLGDWLDHQRAAHQTDAELIERFVADRSEAAFAQLVRRHGPGVLAAARRVAGNPHDAEDVFQATFLVLARKAAAVRKREAVGGWLFAVAARLAARVRADGRKREAGGDVTGVPAPAADAPGFDLRGALDEELARLPARYRAVIVLCYLHGKTRAEAAAELGRSPGAVKIWLERGRDLLRGRLARRGVTAPGGLMLAGLLAGRASAAVSPALVETTTKAAVSFAAGGGAAGAASAGAVALAAGGLKAMLWAKLKVWAGCAAALGLTAGGGGVAWQTAHAQGTGAGAGGVRIVRAADSESPAAAAKPAEPVRNRGVIVADKDDPRGVVSEVLRLTDAEALAAAIDVDIDIKGKSVEEIKKQLDGLIKQLEERRAAAGAKPAAPEFRRVEVKVAPPATTTATLTARAIAFSPDGKLLAAQEGVTVKVYDAATGKVLWQFSTPDGKPATAQVLPNPPAKPAAPKIVTTVTADGVRVWDATAGSDLATVSALEKLAKSTDPETAKLAAELLKRVTAAKPAVVARAAVPKPPTPGTPAAAPKPPAPPAAPGLYGFRLPLLQDRVEVQRAEAEAQRRLAEEAMTRAAEQADLARAAEAKARAEAERAKALAEKARLEAEAARLDALRKTHTPPATPPAAANPGLDALKAELDALRKKVEAMEKAPKR